MSGLGVTDLTVRYGRLTAVDAVTLSIASGEIVAVLGPSGSGKSSLLGGVAGLQPPAAGSVFWDGQDVTGVPVHRRGFVVMFQDGQLFPHLNVARNVGYGLAGRPRVERDARVAELLRLVGLDGYGNRPVSALSGGEAQRVALARSLAPKPRLILLDEPLSSLDRALREHLVGVLRDTLRATGTTALHVTHDQDEAFALADRIGVMMDGRLRQLATPADLWSHPADRDVAAFLGYGPFLDAPAAAALGVQIPPGATLALAPTALSPGALPPTSPADTGSLPSRGTGGRREAGPSMVDGADGVAVDVVGVRARRGGVEASVRLPGGQVATLTLIEPPGDRVSVRVDPSACVVLGAS